ncbi:MAG: ATP-NAD kinase family protein [Candidatus Thermoplasmatota archaeon]|nr:ATP-NAD kinase family protein [Candidatus Thermoplasmatota archaeon]
MIRICFVINPIAGMGGRVGLKGTDNVLEEALKKGARPQALNRAGKAFSRLSEAYRRHRLKRPVEWMCANGEMGEDVIREQEVPEWTIRTLHVPKDPTTAEDTRELVRKAVSSGTDLIVFTGGDGTARDVHRIAGDVPIFGIPAGVKMHSGVFAIDPQTAGELLEHYLRDELVIGKGEIMDLDEDRYRSGEWNIALFGIANTLNEPSFVQTGKMMIEEESTDDVISGIASDLSEKIEEEGLYLIMGPGGTIYSIAEKMGFEKTLLGVDVISKDGIVSSDCSENDLLDILDEIEGSHFLDKVRILLSPIGGQGFFLGRGNLQISPEVIRRIGTDRIIVVSTPGKLETTKVLRVDTGDPIIDKAIKDRGSIKVMTSYRTYRMIKIL